MHSIVIDTSVFIAALRSRRGASYRLLEMAGEIRWRTHMSVALALEYESVGRREADKLGIPDSVVNDIVDMLCSTSQHHAVYFKLRPQLADSDDEFLLELAVVSQCDFIVTHNIRHLRIAERFGIRVVTPGQFLRIIGIEP